MAVFEGVAVIVGVTSGRSFFCTEHIRGSEADKPSRSHAVIGHAVAATLANDGCKKLVLIEDSQDCTQGLTELIGHLGKMHSSVSTLTLSCRLQDPTAIESALQTAVAEFGSIRYCINCCSSSDPRTGNSPEIDPADFRADLDTNQRTVSASPREIP